MTKSEEQLRLELMHPAKFLYQKSNGARWMFFSEDVTNGGAWGHSFGGKKFFEFKELIADFDNEPVNKIKK